MASIKTDTTRTPAPSNRHPGAEFGREPLLPWQAVICVHPGVDEAVEGTHDRPHRVPCRHLGQQQTTCQISRVVAISACDWEWVLGASAALQAPSTQQVVTVVDQGNLPICVDPEQPNCLGTRSASLDVFTTFAPKNSKASEKQHPTKRTHRAHDAAGDAWHGWPRKKGTRLSLTMLRAVRMAVEAWWV